MFNNLEDSKKTAVSNAVIRSSMKPAEKALFAVLKLVSTPFAKTTYAMLKNFLKERRTATENRLQELSASIQNISADDKKSFTLMPIDILLSPALSLTAKGIYMMIRSYATFKGFVIKKDFFLRKSEIGEDAFNTAWKELLDCSLLCKAQNRAVSGQFIYTYQLAELAASETQIAEDPAALDEKTEEKEHQPLSRVINLTAEKVRSFTSAQKKPYTKTDSRTSHISVGTSNRANFNQRIYDDSFWDNIMNISLADTVRAAR